MQKKRGVSVVGALLFELSFNQDDELRTGSGLRIFVLDAWIKALGIQEEVCVRLHDSIDATTMYCQPDQSGHVVWLDYMELERKPSMRLEMVTRSGRKGSVFCSPSFLLLRQEVPAKLVIAVLIVGSFELTPEALRLGSISPLPFETSDPTHRLVVRVSFRRVGVSTKVQGALKVCFLDRKRGAIDAPLYAVLQAFPCSSSSRAALYAPGLTRTGVFFNGESISACLDAAIESTCEITLYLCDESKESNNVVETRTFALSNLISQGNISIAGDHASFQLSFKNTPELETLRFINVVRARRLQNRSSGLFKVKLQCESKTHETE